MGAFSFFGAASLGAPFSFLAGASAGAEAAAASVSNLPGSEASFASEKLAMCLYQRRAWTEPAAGCEIALKTETCRPK